MAGNKKILGAAALLVVLSTISTAFGQNAGPCPVDPADCALPNCRCSSTETPGNLTSAETPQLVFLSFDSAVNVDNFDFYRDALFNRKNPNDQPITATFFVSHDYTIYPNLHELWRNGHEIGLHSISGSPNQQYWQSLNETMWRQEIVDQREQLTSFARIPATDIKGVRAPQLLVGGDTMYKVLEQARLKWDCSRPTPKNQAYWPYTNDYMSTQQCLIDTCPTGEHKAFWTVPIINQRYQGTECSLADQCTPVPITGDDTFNLLKTNFDDHYNGHRAPFSVYARHGWVNGTANEGDDQIWQRRLGYFRFLDHLSTLDDVYIVSISRGLEWVQTPTPLAQVATFPAFQVVDKPNLCTQIYSCPYGAGQTPFPPTLPQERNFHSCIPCPVAYPWVGNHLGRYRYDD